MLRRDRALAVMLCRCVVGRIVSEASPLAVASSATQRVPVEFVRRQLQYRQGATDLLNLLQAQQTLFAARDQLAQTAGARIQGLIHLYEELGGAPIWLSTVIRVAVGCRTSHRATWQTGRHSAGGRAQ